MLTLAIFFHFTYISYKTRFCRLQYLTNLKAENAYVDCASSWTNTDVLYPSANLNMISQQLELSESDVLIENISEDILYKAAEMLIYVNFCPSKEMRYFFNLIHEHKDGITIKQLLLGTNRCLLS